MTIAAELNWILAVLWISLRVSALFFLTPFDAFGRLPRRVKAIFVLAVSFIFLQHAGGAIPAIPNTFFQWASIAISEVVVGLLMAFGIYCAFSAVMFAGRVLDFQAGLGAANILNPATNSHDPLIGTILTMLFTALFFLSGMHIYVLKGISLSFSVLPVGAGVGNLSISDVVRQFGIVFIYGFMLAAPVVLVLALIDLAVGFMSRSMPQVNVYFLFLPLKIYISLLLLGISFKFYLPYSMELFSKMFISWQGVVK